jgi:hypothetical protein
MCLNIRELVRLLSKDYSTIVKEANGFFYTRCERLGIVTKDSDLAVAYAQLQTLRCDTLERLKEMGISPSESSNNVVYTGNHAFVGKQSYSWPKLFIVGICLIGVGIPIINMINSAIRPLQGIGAKLESITNPAALSRRVATVANVLKEVTPERKKELHDNLRIIVRELEPFANDVRPLIFETQNSKSTK